MKSAGIHDVVQTIESAIRHVKSSNPQRRTLLVLDTPSFLLASNPTLNPSVLSSTILRLHALTSHVLVHLPADDALISLSVPPQPLEVHAHNLLVKVAHMSRRILSCRVLDTGFAKDVSGVLRITENSTSGNLDLKLRSGAAPEEQEGTELLYLVKGDGSVKMFERGTGGEV
jgi:elongator complex protein 6